MKLKPIKSEAAPGIWINHNRKDSGNTWVCVDQDDRGISYGLVIDNGNEQEGSIIAVG